MARRRRRGLLNRLEDSAGQLRIVAVLAVLGLAALLIWHSVSRASGPYQRTINASYADLMAGEVQRSNAQGTTLLKLLKRAPELDRATLQSRLDSLTAATAAVATRSASYEKPAPSNDAAVKAAQCMQLRAEATAHVAIAVEGILGLAPRDPVGAPTTSPQGPVAILPISAVRDALVAAGQEIHRSDVLWPSAQAALRSGPGAAHLPRSAWITDPQLVARGPMLALAESLAASPSLSPIHVVSLASISIQPNPLPQSAGAAETYLVPTHKILVSAFITNSGNVAEPEIKVTYTLTALDGGQSTEVVLTRPAPLGVTRAVKPVRLPVEPNHRYRLTVTVTAPPGQTESTNLSQEATLVIAPAAPPIKGAAG